ncbi:M23 family metallopeptidase [Novosphingobium sp. 9]|uniref:M23 family metallopeptidase n=1 Tax=Novosphingobium sp. 9 TaxID=2025349 RepID=UPI0021B6DFA6|nr:M23 family metallopeptidase [Novosphingobium sp. 9]
MLLAAHPALANSSAADISAPIRASQQAAQSASGGEDTQFRRLFSSWQNYEETGFVAVKPKAEVAGIGSLQQVSIPSLVPVDYVRESSGFGLRDHPILGGIRAHKGLDLAAPTGTPIHATADGVVGRAQWVSGYGLLVQLEHGGDLETRYGHMSRIAVADGQFVHKGDVIGYVGQTGYATGPHLHYEVRVDGVAVDPTPYMQVSLASFEKSEGEAKGG